MPVASAKREIDKATKEKGTKIIQREGNTLGSNFLKKKILLNKDTEIRKKTKIPAPKKK